MARAKSFRHTRARKRIASRHMADVLERRLLLATTPIAVDNPSFENPANSDNEQTTVANWHEVGLAFNPTDIDYTNADDSSPTSGALAAPADQKQVLLIPTIFQTVSQTLNTTVTGGDTVYSLTVAVGNSGIEEVGDFQIRLLAGDIEIASTSGNGESIAPSFGFEDVTATSAPITATSPAVGQPLRIELTRGSNGDSVGFDNVRLVAITDTSPPIVSITPPVVTAGAAFSDFDILFSDDTGVDTETIQAQDVIVDGQPQPDPLDVSLQGIDGTFGGPSATATFRIAAPGGSWGSEDNGFYSIDLSGPVFDTRGNRTTSTTILFDVKFPLPDTQPPVASLDAGPAPVIGATTYEFDVTYTDNLSLLAASGNDSQIAVSGPNAFSQLATFVEFVRAGAVGEGVSFQTFRYRITAPGGVFDPADNGTYTVATGPTALADDRGNRVPDGPVGTFEVNVGVGQSPGPSAEFDEGQPVPSDGAANYDFTVTYTDPDTVNAATLDGSDILVTGPNNFSVAASLLSSGLTNAASVTATYRVAAPGGTFEQGDDGAYTISLLPNAVADIDGDAAPAGSLDTFILALAAPVGGLDPEFGTGGVKTFNPPGPGLKTSDVVTLQDGTTVAAAFTNVAAGSADVTLFKTDENGDLVPGFGGAGNGLVTLDIFGQDDRASAILALPSGKFLVAGTTSRYDLNGVEIDADFFVARFNTNGTLDNTFGVVNAGFGIADFGSAKLDRAADLALLNDGRIFVFGRTNADDPEGDFAFARFSEDGIYDTSFGFGGRMVTDLGGADVANAVLLAPDGRFVAAGTTATGTAGSFAVVGYFSDGTVDPTFGGTNTGSILIDFLPGLDEARSIVVQDDGKLIVGGLASEGGPDDAGFDSDFALARLNVDGTPDATFGSGGKVLTEFSGLAAINKVVLQPGGKIVASGLVVSSLNAVGVEDVRVAIARFNSDGSLDGTFSNDGKLVIDFAAGTVSSVGTFGASNASSVVTLAAENLTALEEKFEQFRRDTQGLVTLVKGGAILALATQADNVVLALIVGDAGAPTLFVTLPNVTEIDVTSLLFVVRLVDDLGVDVSSLGNSDLRVTGPNGFSQLAEFVELIGATGNGLERTARYRLDAPGDEFLKADEGAYSLSVEPNGIADISGNFIQAVPIPGATFTVTIPENLANLRIDGGLTGRFAPAVVGGSKASGGTVRVTNDGVIDARATVVVTLYASSDNAFDETEDTAVATINNVRLSLKPGRSKAVKLRFTQYPATLADGDYFLIARIDSGNGLPELKESDNSAPTLAPINIAAPFIDLSATPGSVKGTLAPGAKATASAFVRNGGNVAVKQSVPVTLLASPGDQTLGNGDVALAGPTLKLNLKPAATKSSRIPVTLPATGLAPGSYFLIAVLDQANVTAESDETNNLVVLGSFTIL